MAGISAARLETIRYHESFYAVTSLGTDGSWLAAPHPSVLEAISLVSQTEPVRAYDLGAGVGRHTVPMAQLLPIGSTVTAVDLLPSAVAMLVSNCRAAGVLESVMPVVADLEDYRLGDDPTALIVGFSVIEHLNSPRAMRALLTQCREATVPGGIVSFGVVADRVEIAADGSRSTGIVETTLSAADARACFSSLFAGWTVLRAMTESASVCEERGGVPYRLCGSLVVYTAQKR